MTKLITYRHWQFPTTFIILIIALAAVFLMGIFILGFQIPISTIAIVGGLLIILFGGLAVEVDAQKIQLSFGVGLIRRSIDRNRIVKVERVRNSWWYGPGIRLIPEGWSWSVSGLDAVRLTLNDGTLFRVGTNDLDGLIAALDSTGMPEARYNRYRR
jgi:hypothetical protein